ncbi:cytochrome b [Methylophilaceae bacterium 11]|nr:cytochrome b [Methylophilaceae bacterium 11]
MQKKKIQVWDLPIRLFHWLLVLTITLSYISIEIGGAWIDWHARLGGFALGLIVFRILWGFAGNKQARFSQFMPTPARLLQYFKGEWQGIGHSPLGGLAVLALLGLILLIVLTGLFANDDVTLTGPLFPLVQQSVSDWMTGVHAIAFNGLLAVIALHLLAIAFYWVVKKNNLIHPMLTGKKEIAILSESALIHEEKAKPINFIISIAIALLVVWLIFGNVFVDLLSPEPAAKPPASQHQW